LNSFSYLIKTSQLICARDIKSLFLLNKESSHILKIGGASAYPDGIYLKISPFLYTFTSGKKPTFTLRIIP